MHIVLLHFRTRCWSKCIYIADASVLLLLHIYNFKVMQLGFLLQKLELWVLQKLNREYPNGSSDFQLRAIPVFVSDSEHKMDHSGAPPSPPMHPFSGNLFSFPTHRKALSLSYNIFLVSKCSFFLTICRNTSLQQLLLPLRNLWWHVGFVPIFATCFVFFTHHPHLCQLFWYSDVKLT